MANDPRIPADLDRAGIYNFIKGKVVDTHRWWNNDRYEYSDSATLWDAENMETFSMHVGIDFWDGVSFDSVKASDAVVSLYREIKRGEVEMRIRAKRNAIIADLAKMGISRSDQVEFFLTLSDVQRENCLKLLTANLRSKFRMSLRDQLTKWLQSEPAARAHGSPFSPKQWGCIGPFQPFRRYR